MCTYQTERITLVGSSGKGPSASGPTGWFPVTRASVYYDHPVSAPDDHTVNIDFLNPAEGPAARVAVELSVEAARALAEALQATLAMVPPTVQVAVPGR